jgi:transposase InsO family protein
MVIDHITKKMKVSVRRACMVLGIGRSTYHYQSTTTPLESVLTERIIELALQYGRYGYRRITALLCADGWYVNHKRVERIWRQEGLKVPARQPKRRRLWLNDGSIVRLRAQHPDHV